MVLLNIALANRTEAAIAADDDQPEIRRFGLQLRVGFEEEGQPFAPLQPPEEQDASLAF